MPENKKSVNSISVQVKSIEDFIKELLTTFDDTTLSDTKKKNFFLDNMEKAKQAVEYLDNVYDKVSTVHQLGTDEEAEFAYELKIEVCKAKEDLTGALSRWRDFMSKVDTDIINEIPVINEDTIVKAMNNSDIKEAMGDLGYPVEKEVQLSNEQATKAMKAFTHMVIIKKDGKEKSTFFRANNIDEINDSLDAIVTQYGEDIDIDLYSVSFTPVEVRKSVRTTFKV